MTSLTSFLRERFLPNLLRPMLPSVGEFAILSDGYFIIYFTIGEKEIIWLKQIIIKSDCVFKDPL